MSLLVTMDSNLVRHICIDAISLMVAPVNDELFRAPSAAYSCYPFVRAELEYTQELGTSPVESRNAVRVSPGQWIYEAAMWCVC